MPTLSTFSHYLLIFTFLTLTLNSNANLNDNPNFDPNTALFGDAELINGSVQFNRPINSSSFGFILQKTPLKSIQPKTSSFSTDFTFSISPHIGQGYGLSLEINGFGIRFNGHRVAIELGKRLAKASSFVFNLSSGEKHHSWVDYEASSRQIEIRIGKFGSPRPYNPVLMYPIDFSRMWKDDEVCVRLSSSKDDNSTHSISVYSWRFRVRNVPKLLHSQPVNPQDLSIRQVELRTEEEKWFCPLGVLTFGCGALAAMVLLSLWALFVNRWNVTIPAEDDKLPVDFRYRKIDVVVENGFEDVKK